jgi:hypothetical protein
VIFFLNRLRNASKTAFLSWNVLRDITFSCLMQFSYVTHDTLNAALVLFYTFIIFVRSRDSSVGIATGYGLDDQGEREFESR